MIEFSKEHSKAWIELMAAYQEFRAKVFYWAHENDDVKYRDLYMELSPSVKKRDLHKRLLITDFLRSTDMWDEKAILLASGELTELALREEDEAAAYSRMALKKIKHCPERMNIADQVFMLASAEAGQERPDCVIFYNGCMLLHDLGCKEQLEQFIQEYKRLICLASGLDEADLCKLAELT